MCVDRLEVGLKPACVTACLGNALNFGVIENTPENREQVKADIPGLPRTDITNPNIRFQQTRTLPMEMTRTDGMAVKYHKDKDSGVYQPVVDKKKGLKRQWNLSKLRSREDPLVIFTLASQGVIGSFMFMFLGALMGFESMQAMVNSSVYLPMLFLLIGIESVALFLSTMHLGKPHRFYRAFNNLRYSPVSREVAGIAVFFNCLLGHTFFSLFDYAITDTLANLFGYAAVISGPIAIYFMYKIYRIEARPYWNHWQVLTAFYGNMLTMGCLLTGLIFVPVFIYNNLPVADLLNLVALLMFSGLLIEAIGHVFHTRDLNKNGREGAVSSYEQATTFGKTWISRNVLIGINLLLIAGLYLTNSDSILALAVWSVVTFSVLITAIVSRALFYVLVVPTTMPGAFFWKNKTFEEHARESGLANMPQVGVVPDIH